MQRPEIKTILLAIESRGLRAAIESALQAEGFLTVSEADLKLSLQIFEKHSVHAVILDTLSLAGDLRTTPKGRFMPILWAGDVPLKESVASIAKQSYDLVGLFGPPLDISALLQTLKTVFADPAAESLAQRDATPTQSPFLAEPPAETTDEHWQDEAHPEQLTPLVTGSLADLPFAELLGKLYQQRASGVLELTLGPVKKTVHFKGGHPALVKSNRLDECLGRMLVRAKVISEEECEASLRKMKASNRQQGTVLVAMGSLTPESLRQMLDQQVQIKLFDAFAWQQGTYKFDPKARPEPAVVPLGLSTATAIYRGVKRKLDAEWIERRMEDVLPLRPTPSSDPLLRFQTLELDSADRALLPRLQLGFTLRVLLRAHPGDRQAVLKLVYALRCAGMMTFEGEAVSTADGEAVPIAEEEVVPIAEDEVALTAEDEVLSIADSDVMPAAEGDVVPAAEGDVVPAAVGERVPAAVGGSDTTGEVVFDFDGMPTSDAPILFRTGADRQVAFVRRHMALQVHKKAREDHFQRLGLSRDATTAQIAEAFRKLAKRYHPDNVTDVGSEQVASLYVQMFRLICESYALLRDDKMRTAYLARLERISQPTQATPLGSQPGLLGEQTRIAEPSPPATGSSAALTEFIEPSRGELSAELRAKSPAPIDGQEAKPANADVSEDAVILAEKLYSRARGMLRKKEYARARQVLEKVVSLFPTEGEYRAQLGFAIFQTNPKDADTQLEARDQLNQAVTLSPTLDKPHLYLGYVYREMSQQEMSIHEFELALQCNPGCADAMRELRLLRSRGKAISKRVFTRIWEKLGR